MKTPSFIRKIGAHESVEGGLHTAFERIGRVGGTALQIFTRNQRQWAAAPVSDEEADLFASAWKRWGPHPVASHASYLINLASADQALRERSVTALAEELSRCARLGIPWVVLHPGSAGSAARDEALARAAASLDEALARAGELGPTILLENTAGQGSGLGAELEELTAIAALSNRPGRIGFCLDTCHAFAAGYDVRSREGLDRALARLDVASLALVHVNDSKGGLGSRLDRHEHIGQGAIGREGFAAIVNHPRLAGLPMILETHKEKDLALDLVNLAALRSLMEENGPS